MRGRSLLVLPVLIPASGGGDDSLAKSHTWKPTSWSAGQIDFKVGSWLQTAVDGGHYQPQWQFARRLADAGVNLPAPLGARSSSRSLSARSVSFHERGLRLAAAVTRICHVTPFYGTDPSIPTCTHTHTHGRFSRTGRAVYCCSRAPFSHASVHCGMVAWVVIATVM